MSSHADEIAHLKHELGEERAKRQEAEAAQAAMAEALKPFAKMDREDSDLDEIACQRGLPSMDGTMIVSREFRQAAEVLANLTPAAAWMVRIREGAEKVAEDHEAMARFHKEYAPCDCEVCKAVRGEGEKA